MMLLVKLAQAILTWDWIRENNSRMEDIEVDSWEELRTVENSDQWFLDHKEEENSG